MTRTQFSITSSEFLIYKMLVILFALICTGLSAQQAGAQSPGPTIFFTDLSSGPNSGGESVSGFAGAYVTIYGNNFGVTQGSSTVTLNGANCLRVVSWGTNWLWYQKIVVQLGPSCTTGDFVVNVGGIDSTASHPTVGGAAIDNALFTVRSGNIYCVSTGGSDSNAGKFPNCWKTISHAAEGGGAAMAAGDIAYVENGVSAAPGGGPYQDTLTLGKTGTAANPFALVAYPGATVTIGTATGDDRGVMVCSNLSGCPNGQFWVIAGLTIRAGCEPIYITEGGQIWRIIGNDVSAPNCGGGQSGDISIGEPNVLAYGNLIHDGAVNTASSVTKLHHATYIADGTHAVDYAWNQIQNNHANRGVQVFTSTPGGSGDIYDVHVHDNLIHDNRGVAILFNQTNASKGPLEAYNNVIYNAGLGPDFQDGSSQYQCMLASSTGTVQFYNNTLFHCGESPSGGMGCFVGDSFALTNNICQQPSTLAYFDSGSSAVSCAKNLFFGGSGGVPSSCTNGAVNVDPLFSNLAVFDFHLTVNSPAIDAGQTVASLTLDRAGIVRPQGSGFDIGAYEYFSGGSTVQKPNPPTNLALVVQ